MFYACLLCIKFHRQLCLTWQIFAILTNDTCTRIVEKGMIFEYLYTIDSFFLLFTNVIRRFAHINYCFKTIVVYLQGI